MYKLLKGDKVMKALINKLSYKECIVPKEQGIFIGNYKCHVNCLSYYTEHKEDVKSIVGCLQVFGNNETAAHFIVELKDGSFIDPTYGNMIDLYSYCIPIEKYDPTKFSPNRELSNLKAYFQGLLPWYLRLTNKKGNM